MKLRNIISIVTAGLFMMSSCTDEELIDSSTPDSGLSISLTTKGVMTKAAADGYTHSTPDEIKINTCVIAFFDVNTNERVGFSYNTFEAASGNLEDGRAYYSVSNILVKGGTYNMLVLANSSLSQEAIQAANTYSAFKALKETLQDQGAATFDAANLVKFGEKEVTINKGEANEIQVELTQLAARIDLSFKVNVPAEEVGTPVVEEKWTMDALKELVTTKNPNTYEPGSSEPGECKMHSHTGKWLYVPNNTKTTTITKKSWLFVINKVTVSNVVLRSGAFMSTSETAENANDTKEYLVRDFEVASSGSTTTLPFYTYEKTYNPQANPLTIKVDGNLKYGTFEEKTVETFSAEYQWISDNGGQGWGKKGYFDNKTVISSETKTTQEMTKTIDNMEKSYKLAFNPAKSADCNTNGVVHGNLYDVVGTIDVNTREAKFNWTLKPWNVRHREISVDIVDPAFLVVANTEMTMPNITSISTMFQSSSPITISNEQVSNGTSNSNLKYTITKSDGNSGSIDISSELPINFVPKEISFTVTNEEGLSENVKVHQYPPLYIANETTGVSWSDNQGQNNKKMYTFKSLIANFTSFPLPDDRNNVGENSDRWKRRTEYTNFMQNNAVLAYPETNSKTETFYSTGYADRKYYSNQKVIETVENTENEYKVSPNFMLASQAGMNSPSSIYDNKKEFCRHYREYTEDGIEYGAGEWRMPTKAELYLIDILQNVKRCDVKKILEGGAYWVANTNIVIMLDPRTSNNETSAAVRCVRDIK